MAGVVWVGWDRGTIPLELFVSLETWWLDALLGLGAGLGLIAAWGLGRRWLAAMRRLEEEIAGALRGIEPSEALALALISGFSEELFFRGAVQSSWGWPWSVVLFALLHLGPGGLLGVWTLFALVAGAVFAWLTLLHDNILAAILAHALVNAVHLHRLAKRGAALDPEA